MNTFESYNRQNSDYLMHKRLAIKWAKYALENKKNGEPWQECAAMAHAYLKYAILIIS